MSLSRTLLASRGRIASQATYATAAPRDEMLLFRSKVMPNEKAKLARYGGRQTVTALPGDGIGPEMIAHVQRIFTFANVPVDFETMQLNSDLSRDEDLENAIVAIKRNGVCLKGNIETKFDDPQFKSRNMEIRRRLDLFANVLHTVSIPTVPTRHKDIDIVMIRENTEGEYSGLEHETTKGVVESLKIVTKDKMERIARFAFEYALRYDRKNVTAVHKANIQKLGDGLFLKIATNLAKNEYPEIKFQAMIVDNASMQLVSRPQQFSGGIMLMPNLYGNIISNIACGLVGGPGLVSGMNIGKHYAVFETATRNTGTSLAGQDVANPTAFIRAACDMLCYLGYYNDANLISDCLFRTLTVQRVHTADIGGKATASELVTSVLENIEKQWEKTHHHYHRA
uniref:Isocitrate dehydrogenase [NAD] subunit, mitochondrial n=1 Tax=Panagrellus redivivus TaxID=6233 RepID=A0A7E4VVL1_PANRE